MWPPWLLRVKRLVLSEKTSDWCKLPYPGHSKGCPNFGKKKGCPPLASKINDILDITQNIYLVFSTFDLAAHIERMRAKHPDWSERQLRCCLYWQNKSRKDLDFNIKYCQGFLGPLVDITLDCPEATGVNVYATCYLAGLKLEKIRHLEIVHHVALLGIRTVNTQNC